jgi:hypothetical protein
MHGKQLDICFFLAEYDDEFGGHLERYNGIEESFLNPLWRSHFLWDLPRRPCTTAKYCESGDLMHIARETIKTRNAEVKSTIGRATTLHTEELHNAPPPTGAGRPRKHVLRAVYQASIWVSAATLPGAANPSPEQYRCPF